MQQGAFAHPRQQLSGDADTDQQRLGVLDPLQREVISAGDVGRLQRQPAEGVLGVFGRRTPIDARHVHPLMLELVSEQIDADVGDVDRPGQQEL
ncbi:MAG: hypothetical protein JOZ64_06590 [Solirubrobacterales bacterium]|nr:hypothetical protein [Solirubrobacterales bacterium]